MEWIMGRIWIVRSHVAANPSWKRPLRWDENFRPFAQQCDCLFILQDLVVILVVPFCNFPCAHVIFLSIRNQHTPYLLNVMDIFADPCSYNHITRTCSHTKMWL